MFKFRNIGGLRNPSIPQYYNSDSSSVHPSSSAKEDYEAGARSGYRFNKHNIVPGKQYVKRVFFHNALFIYG